MQVISRFNDVRNNTLYLLIEQKGARFVLHGWNEHDESYILREGARIDDKKIIRRLFKKESIA